MDKSTLSNYGWIVIAVLVLSVMIALATPFGKFISNAVQNTTQGLFDVNQNALNSTGLIIVDDQEFDVPNGNGGTETPAPVPGATFTDGTTLTWEDLKLTENETKYSYDASQISDTTIGHNTFSMCRFLESITIPSSVTTIEDGAFFNCTSLTNIFLPEGITTIGYAAFQGCTSLESIIIPSSVTTIGDDAFFECDSLTSIDLSGCTNFTIISDMTFNYCTSLTNIFLPEGITTIGSAAFADCTFLTSITYKGTTAQWNAITFGYYWNANCKGITVTCTDGTITIPAYSE